MKKYKEKAVLFIAVAVLLASLTFFGCKPETDYVEKTYVSAVEINSNATENGVSVSMTTKTEGATIYYTTDGTEPTKESTVYTSALEFEKDAIIKAIAVKGGMENSPVSYAKVSIKEKTITETKTEYVEKTDTTAPNPVVLGENSAIAGDAKVLLSWTNPADEDFYGTRISFEPKTENVSNPIVVEGKASASSSALIKGLSNGTEYTFSLVALDKSQNASKSVEVKASPIDSSDKTAPAKVTNLTAENLDGAVLLTWTDPSDSDLFGIEITYTENTNTQSRAIITMEEGSVFIAPKTQRAKITNLTNGTEYTFTVKTMDTSGNKGNGVTAKAKPKAGDPLEINLSATVPTSNAYTTNYTGNKSNTTVTVTANIKTASTVKRVVYKKDGSVNAKTLLADTEAKEATKDSSDDKKWTFEISATDETANGTYTVAAIDKAGREETEQITIDHFDFTVPAKVKIISGKYTSENSSISFNWTEPSDDDFDKVEITYTSSDDGLNYSTPSEPESVSKGTKEKTVNIYDNKASYKFSFVSIDALGNRSKAKTYVVYVNKEALIVPEGFVKVDGASFDGTETWTPKSYVFVSGRAITIRNLLVSDHEVTQGEYETYCKYYSSSSRPNDIYGKGENYPAYWVNWYDAIVYCNLRSIAEDLTPVYKLGEESDPKNWTGIISTDGKYCGPPTSNSQWDAITMDIEADGYRLPTEAEWEYLARGGETTSTEYSGSDDLDEVAWFYRFSEYHYETHEVKGKAENNLNLYDMSGNVYELCWDWFDWDITSSTPETGAASDSDRCRRGDGFSFDPYSCSVSDRSYCDPYYRSYKGGFRVVRTAGK